MNAARHFAALLTVCDLLYIATYFSGFILAFSASSSA